MLPRTLSRGLALSITKLSSASVSSLNRLSPPAPCRGHGRRGRRPTSPLRPRVPQGPPRNSALGAVGVPHRRCILLVRRLHAAHQPRVHGCAAVPPCCCSWLPRPPWHTQEFHLFHGHLVVDRESAVLKVVAYEGRDPRLSPPLSSSSNRMRAGTIVSLLCTSAARPHASACPATCAPRYAHAAARASTRVPAPVPVRQERTRMPRATWTPPPGTALQPHPAPSFSSGRARRATRHAHTGRHDGLSCVCGISTSDASADVVDFGLLVCDGNRLGTQVVTFLIGGPRRESTKSLRTYSAFYCI